MKNINLEQLVEKINNNSIKYLMELTTKKANTSKWYFLAWSPKIMDKATKIKTIKGKIYLYTIDRLGEEYRYLINEKQLELIKG